MQSRRVWLPRVEPLADFAAVTTGAHLAVPGGPPPSPSVTNLLVGPEGGFTESEQATAPGVGLGPHVLRAETAAIVGGALLAALRAGVVRSAQ